MTAMKNTLTSLALWLFYVPLAHAQDFGKSKLEEVAGQANIQSDIELPQLIGNLVKVFIGALGLIFLLLTVYAGYLYLTAQGDEEKVTHAKDTLKRGVIGMVIITAAYVIAAFVIGAITRTTAGTAAP